MRPETRNWTNGSRQLDPAAGGSDSIPPPPIGQAKCDNVLRRPVVIAITSFVQKKIQV